MACKHFKEADEAVLSSSHAKAYALGCEECRKINSYWVHLRQCLVCGNVACCDQSPNKHATKHFHASHHPVMRSVQPGEHWGWCYVDGEFVEQL